MPSQDQEVLNLQPKLSKHSKEGTNMPELLKGYESLTSQQYKVATADPQRNIRLLAPPGSGKTFTVKYRYQYLTEQNVNPRNIVVVTYSKDMADEMREKILDLVPLAQGDQISTIHAFCFRLLRNWTKTPYNGWNFPKNSWTIKNILEDLIATTWQEEEKPNYNEVLNFIDFSKGQNRFDQEFFIDILGYQYGSWLWSIAENYQEQMVRAKEMTFSDMLWYTENLLISDPNFKAFCKERFTHIIIDEAQDTNKQAFRILLSWTPISLLVGDTDQMMYRFSGAAPELMLSDYADNIETIKLDKNFRSISSVIEASSQLITHNYTNAGGPYNQEYLKEVSGIKGEDQEEITYTMGETPEEEANIIAEIINKEIEEKNRGYGDFFVGARTKGQLGYLEGVLFRNKIKFINIASNGSFWGTRHVKALVDYLRLTHDPTSKEALKSVYNIPSNNHSYAWSDKRGRFQKGDYCSTRYLGKEFLSKIDFQLDNIPHFLDTDPNAWRYKTNQKDYWNIGPTKAQDLLEYIDKLAEYNEHCLSVGEMLEEIANTSIEKWLKHTEGISDDDTGNGKLDDLQTVIDIANNYSSIDKFLVYVDQMIQAVEDAKNDDWSGYVIISTYHRLKGLERPVIIGMGWAEGESSKGNPVGLLPHTFSLTSPPQFGILPNGGQVPIEDERCIAFVCVSRAIDKVYLTGTKTYRDWILQPSRFVYELGVKLEEQ